MIFLRNLREVIRALRGEPVLSIMRCMYGDVYTIKRETVDNWHSLRISKTLTFFNYCGYENEFIAAVEYTVYDTYIKINNLSVQQDDLSCDETCKLVSALIRWVETEAKSHNKHKLVVSINTRNMIFYLGFILQKKASLTFALK